MNSKRIFHGVFKVAIQLITQPCIKQDVNNVEISFRVTSIKYVHIILALESRHT